MLILWRIFFRRHSVSIFWLFVKNNSSGILENLNKHFSEELHEHTPDIHTTSLTSTQLPSYAHNFPHMHITSLTYTPLPSYAHNFPHIHTTSLTYTQLSSHTNSFPHIQTTSLFPRIHTTSLTYRQLSWRTHNFPDIHTTSLTYTQIPWQQTTFLTYTQLSWHTHNFFDINTTSLKYTQLPWHAHNKSHTPASDSQGCCNFDEKLLIFLFISSLMIKCMTKFTNTDALNLHSCQILINFFLSVGKGALYHILKFIAITFKL